MCCGTSPLLQNLDPRHLTPHEHGHIHQLHADCARTPKAMSDVSLSNRRIVTVASQCTFKFPCCPSSQCRARIESASIAGQSSATSFRQRGIFPTLYTRRHLFCRHSSLQHWGVFVSYLRLEWMTCFNWEDSPPLALDLFLYDCCRPVHG